jgi:tRNA/rRNA methyltransferase/tRNA (cytidine32/uridine32-2'-O)-methyltransferase
LDQRLDRIAVILFQPQDVVNVAAIIRVMSNFGLTDLRLVEPAAFDAYRILGIAHHTERIVEQVRRFPTLAEATADCTFVLGTTGRPRHQERLLVTPRQAAPLLLQTAELAPEGRVAVLFGREQDGLPNEALDLCHGVLTIPTSPENRSLNLAQAALVVAYELYLAATAPVAEAPAAVAEPAPDLASGDEREAMFDSLRDLLLALYPTTTEARLTASLSRLRGMLMRSAPRHEEAEALANLCRHAARVLRSR